MHRSLVYSAVLGAMALASTPMHAQAASASPARVRNVSVRGSGDNIEVEIQTSGSSVAPDTQAIVGPNRIVVDFPGALPAAELKALKVNRGVLKGVRSGLFFSNPPITRVVLDLTEARSYQVVTSNKNSVIVKLGSAAAPASARTSSLEQTSHPVARLQNASLPQGPNSGSASISTAVSNGVSSLGGMAAAASEPPAPTPAPAPPVTVTFESGLLHIHADKATLAQVLFEVQKQTQAEIAIPAGAEREEVAAEIGPAPARDVLGSLLNGSPYNFVFVGNEMQLERVILTRRDSSIF